MGFLDRAKQTYGDSQARKAAGGFKKAAAYLGGHPEAIDMARGHLILEDETLTFTGRASSTWGFKQTPVEFSVSAREITAVDFKDKDELRNAPKGYFLPLPVAWAPGYGSKMKHPVPGGGKLLGLLTINYVDPHGDEQTVVFANKSESQISFDRNLANRIVAARSRAKDPNP